MLFTIPELVLTGYFLFDLYKTGKIEEVFDSAVNQGPILYPTAIDEISKMRPWGPLSWGIKKWNISTLKSFKNYIVYFK